MRIILIGYMGSGKSAYAKQIASVMNMKCIDTDRLIETNEGMSIYDIFSTHGESYFRKKETELIDNLANEDNVVIATGGGLPCFGNNLERLKKLGLTIYLKASVEELVCRLEESHQKRPLVIGKNHRELLEFVSGNLANRENYYNLAEIKYDANGRHAEGLLAIIKFILNKAQ